LTDDDCYNKFAFIGELMRKKQNKTQVKQARHNICPAATGIIIIIGNHPKVP